MVSKPINMALRSKILSKTKVDLNVTMPYDHHNDAFTYNGSIGATDLQLFTPIVFPVAHVNIEKGHMASMEFLFHATPHQSKDELIMRYSDLAIDIPLKHKTTEHALSILANSAIHKFNPKKNGKLRVATINYDRVPYKGLGGYVVKSILTGVTHTIAPFRSHNEEQTEHSKDKVKSSTRAKKKDKRHKTN